MIGVRHEKYNTNNKYPFHLGIDLNRTPYNCSTEQNWHENIEIQLCTAGEGSVLLNGEEYDISKDCITIVNSNVIHYTSTDSTLTYTCLIIDTAWCRQMGIDYDRLTFTPIIKNPLLKDLISELTAICSDDSVPISVAKANKILLQIMIELIEHYSDSALISNGENKKFNVVKSALIFICENYSKKITLTEIAQSVFYDKYALCREVKKYTGKTIVENLNQYRCTMAVNYLYDGYNVAETASLCGFDNLSFFTKTFKKYMGNTPSYYKKQIK